MNFLFIYFKTDGSNRVTVVGDLENLMDIHFYDRAAMRDGTQSLAALA